MSGACDLCGKRALCAPCSAAFWSRPVAVAALPVDGPAGGRPAAGPADDDCRRGPADDPRWSKLSAKEREVARLVSEALTNEQIAARLFISPHTVNYHLRRTFRKLVIESRVELATLASRLAGPTDDLDSELAAS